MAFQKFTDTAKSYKPKVSFRANGVLRLNSGAVSKFSLKSVKFVTLLYDADRSLIGIKPCDELEEGAIKLRNGKTSAYVPARKFADYFGIRSSKADRLDAKWDEKDGMIIVELPSPE